MLIKKSWNFGFGTIFSLIVVYFIYLYSKDKGWALLAFLSKWYLIVIGGLIALSLGIIILVILFSMIMFLVMLLRLKVLSENYKKRKSKDYIDVEYDVKE